MAAGDYGPILRRLKLIISKDSNLACVIEAVACCGALAKGVRQSFSPSARGLVPVLLDRYQVKNTSLTAAVTNALGLMHKCAPPHQLVH